MQKVLALSLVAIATGAHAETFFDDARVQSAEPQYETISVPRQECATQNIVAVQQVDTGPTYGGAIIGGVTGGLLGNRVGRGHGREAATALGAVVGALAGDSLASRGGARQYVEVPEQVTNCRTVSDLQTQITGYRVNYWYRGQSYTTFTRSQPGPFLRVRVSVNPA